MLTVMIALLLAILIGAVIVVVVGQNRRLTLRGMLLLTAFIAILITAILGYRRASMATLMST